MLSVALAATLTLHLSRPQPTLAKVVAGPASGPANPHPFEIRQPNGGVVSAYAIGDEDQYQIVSSEGYTLLQDQAGFWTYAQLDPTGQLIASDRRAGLDPPPPLAVKGFPRRTAGTHSPYRNQDAQQDQYIAVGAQPVLILLVQFTDQAPIGTTATHWMHTFFDPTDSVATYYREASQNLLQLVPAQESFGAANDGIVGWLTLPYPHPNTSAIGQAVRQVARDAVTAADPFVNFARFDTNGDGYLSSSELHVIVVFAGYEGSYSPALPCGKSAWGHRANLSNSLTLDNVTLLSSAGNGGYVGIGEWHCTSSNPPGHPATIGPIVHEMGHDLGLPDLYDTDLSTYGLGTWSPMALGGWNTVAGRDLGHSPVYPDAFSRTYLHWVTPTLVAATQSDIRLEPSTTNGQVMQLIAKSAGVDWAFRYHTGQGEYYLIENRQRLGYDASLPGCGLLIWHVDERAPFDNTANADEDRPLVDLQQADGADELQQRNNTGDEGDPFPGTSNNTTFARFTKPSSILNTGQFSGITITNILADDPSCPTTPHPLRAGSSVEMQPSLNLAADTSLNLAPASPPALSDVSIRMSVQLTSPALPLVTPAPALNEHIYLPLQQR